MLKAILSLLTVCSLSFGAFATEELQTAIPYSLTSWNIYKGQNQGLFDELDKVLATSDFVNVQEFLLNDQQEKMMAKFPNVSWNFAKSFLDGSDWTGVTTISKNQPYEALAFRSPDGQPFTGTPKMSMVTKYKIENGSELWIANTHALNFNIDLAAYERQIDAVINELRKHQGPIIFTGDFNTWMPGRWEHLLARANELGLKHLELESPTGFFSVTMDHIFYRDLKNVKGSVLEQFTKSDHLPLKIEFTLN